MNVHSIRMLAAAAAGGALLWLATLFGGSQDEPDWRDMNAEVAAWLDGASEGDSPVSEEGDRSENAPLPPAPEPAGTEPEPAGTGPEPAGTEPELAGTEAAPESEVPDEPSIDGAPPAAAAAAPDGLVDINRATAEALDALPGIGPSKAKAIVDYREANGPFATADALMNVKGIGPAVFGKIEASITVGRIPPSDANVDDGK